MSFAFEEGGAMLRRLALAFVAIAVAGCSDGLREPPPYRVDDSQIHFADHVTSQSAPETEIADLSFTDRNGRKVTLREFGKDKSLVVVMTRGYTGAICPYCSAQTSRLIANYKAITQLGAEVVLIYPLSEQSDSPRLAEFLKHVNELNSAPPEQIVPFPVLLDVGLEAVGVLGIRQNLSKPATYILDRNGAVKFAYVGGSLADRPSVKAILEQLQQLQPAITLLSPLRTSSAGEGT